MDAASQREPVRVLLADDQRLVRESLGALLGLLAGIDLVASASDGEEALAHAKQRRPDVVLMDLRMPRVDGIETTRRLRERHPEVRVIALTTYADDDSVLGALRAGARGSLTKDASSDDIRAAILTVAAGEAVLDPSVHPSRCRRVGDRRGARRRVEILGRARAARRSHAA
jgi:DNA-binding NarL/FixJ family response regulator